MPNKVEQMISGIAKKTLPTAASIFRMPAMTDLIADNVNFGEEGLNPRVVPDDSGKKYFAFGISRWKSSGADIIGE